MSETLDALFYLVKAYLTRRASAIP